jgi:hypothetical protein
MSLTLLKSSYNTYFLYIVIIRYYKFKIKLINKIDETMSFNKNTIRIIGTNNEPRFVAKDIYNILELTNVTESL